MDYKILDWDSRFFEFKTAEILLQQLDQASLTKVLDDMRNDGVRLAYWPAKNQADFDIEQLGGNLIDKKVTFIAGLKSLGSDHFIPTDRVEKYQSDMPEETLLDLAVQAGHFSRFARDPQFPREKFIVLYHEWIHNCLNGKMADEILVIREDADLIGMITVQNKSGLGDIGLIAVKEAFRGRYYGEMLVRAAQQWFIDHNIMTGQVVTQRDNRAACSLYEKCDYHLKHTDYIYHFWL